jgi:predicted outer membrane repeat protein
MSCSLFSGWLQAMRRKSEASRRRLRRSSFNKRRGFRPLLEGLEDRLTPSTLPVTSIADNVNQPGTLRYDVAHAQSGDTILLTGAVKSGIVLTQGELLLNQHVTITTAGNHQIMISGDGLSRVFEVASGAKVSLSKLILTGGDGVASPTSSDPNDGVGGALLVDSGGTLTVTNSILSGNSSAFDGGAIAAGSSSTLYVNNSNLSDNSTGSLGGAIFSINGTVAVNNSALSGNSAFDGGAIFGFFGTASVNNCALSGNSARNAGGAIAALGTMTVSNSILSGNSAGRFGGAIVNEGLLTVSNSILSGNSAGRFGGAIANSDGGTATVSNSILSGNTADDGASIYNASTPFGASSTTITSSQLSDNTASSDGGAIFNNLGTVNVGTSMFFDNSPDNIVGGFNDLGGNTGLP